MIHSSFSQPKVFAYAGTAVPTEIDRAQELSASATLNREKIKEIGRDGIVAWRKRIPTQSVTLRQLEYGSMEFWLQVTNQALTEDTIDQNDFKTSRIDIATYDTDDDATFKGTDWYPNLRTSGWSLNIGDPEAIAERNFSFVGEDEIHLINNNKYLIYLTTTAAGASHTFTLGSAGFATYPIAAEDPDNSGNYFLKVTKLKAGVVTELVEGTDFTYNSGTHAVVIAGSAASDVYHFYYSATTYISGGDYFVENDADEAAITADSVSVYLTSGQYVYRLQSVAIDVSFTRKDIKEVGNTEVVATGITDKTVRITLGRILEAFTIEQILRGVSSTYGKIDGREFNDDNTLYIKIYSDSTKDTFLMGYKFTNLAPTSLGTSTPTSDYITRDVVLEGEEFVITSSESEIDS